jgi:hypothetical protein
MSTSTSTGSILSASSTGFTSLSAVSTAPPPTHLWQIATELVSSDVRAVETCEKLGALSRKVRRAFAQTRGQSAASPIRWPHEERMLACYNFATDPVLGVGGTKRVRSEWPSIDLDSSSSASEEPAPEQASAPAAPDLLEQHTQSASESDSADSADSAAADPFADLLDSAPARSSCFVEPAADEHFHVSDSVKSLLRTVEKISRTRPVNVALRGPTGAGKTSLPEWFAWRTRRPFFIFDTPTIRETVDAFGQRTLEHDEEGRAHVALQLSGLMQAIQTPRACVVIDEATRAHASILNGLLALLDHRKRVWLDALQANIEMAPGVVIFVTANIGSEYTGTWIWDAAFENRMDFQLDVGYLEQSAEQSVLERKTGASPHLARAFVEIANITRARVADTKEPLPHAISTRQLLRACEGVQAGLSALEALEYTIVPTYSAEGGSRSDRAHVLQIIQGKLVA